jgi:hypothetical protein
MIPDPDKETIGVTDTGLIELCCLCPDNTPIPCDLWVCWGEDEPSTGGDVCLPDTRKIAYETDFPPFCAGGSTVFDFKYDECFRSNDTPNTLYPCTGLTNSCSSCVRLKVEVLSITENTNDRDYEIRIIPFVNPEGHPGFTFTLTFPKTMPHTSQLVEISYPDSPLSGLIGAVTFSFGTSQEAAASTCQLYCCEPPTAFRWHRIYPVIVDESNGPHQIYYHVEHNSSQFVRDANIADPCCYVFDIEATYRRYVAPGPENNGGYRTDFWSPNRWCPVEKEVLYLGANGEITGVYYGAGPFGGGNFRNNCQRATQWRNGTTDHFHSYASVFHAVDSGNGYNKLTDLSGEVGGSECGDTRFNQRCDSFKCPPAAPGNAVMASFKIHSFTSSWSALYGGSSLGGSANALGGVLIGAKYWDSANNIVYGGVNPGDKPWPSFPVESLPYNALEGDTIWDPNGPANPLGVGHDFEFYCDGSPDNQSVLGIYSAGVMYEGIQDHPDNPANIKRVLVGDMAGGFDNGYWWVRPIAECLNKGTYPFNFMVRVRVDYWDRPSTNELYPVEGSMTLH